MVSRNQVSFVTGLQSYLIQPVAKIHFIALAPQAPQMGGCNRAKGIVSQLEPLHGSNQLHKSFLRAGGIYPPSPHSGLLRLLRNRPQPFGGCRHAARTGTSSFHPSSSYGCFATALGARVSASVPERAFYLGSPLIPQHHGGSNTSRHHVLGGLPRAVCCCRRHSVGWYGLNANRFSSGQSPEFTGLLSGN